MHSRPRIVTRIRHMIRLVRISLRDTGTSAVVQEPLVIYVFNVGGGNDSFGVSPVQEIMSFKETLENS
jgi:hypothetical protein